MNYHMLKMSEINKTIKQLWRQVYRGNDIDHVRISILIVSFFTAKI